MNAELRVPSSLVAHFSRTPDLQHRDAAQLRAQLRGYFLDTFDRYESLFETLADDAAFYTKPISLRHPLIFYYGHTATFFINKLLLTRMINERINPRFESMFAVGVDEMSWDDLDSTHYDWPASGEVKAYRDQVRELVTALIDTAPLAPPVDWHNPWWAIIMGIEHERIHLETSSVLIRQHQLARVKPHPLWQPCRESGAAPQNAWVNIPAGEVKLAKTKTDAHYGWDNEYGAHSAQVPAFKAGRFLVSNGEFLEFVDAGGYQANDYWQEEGRSWRDFARAEHPTFWIRCGKGWRLRLMTEEVAMPWDWPVEVNYHEAKAFCHWKSAAIGQPVRLPTRKVESLLAYLALHSQPHPREHLAALAAVVLWVFALGVEVGARLAGGNLPLLASRLHGRSLLEHRPSYHPEYDIEPNGLAGANLYLSNFRSYGVKLQYNYR